MEPSNILDLFRPGRRRPAATPHEDAPPRHPAIAEPFNRADHGMVLGGPASGSIDRVLARHERVLASIVPMESYRRSARNLWTTRSETDFPRPQPWEEKVLRWMRDGPSFVGWAARMYALPLGAGAELVVQEVGREDEWVESSDERLWQVLSMWRGLDETQGDLLARLIEFDDSVGQCVQVLRKLGSDGSRPGGHLRGRGGDWYYSLHAHTAVTHDPDRGLVVIRDVPDAESGSRWYHEVRDTLVDHLFLADLEWPGVPHSQMRRVLQDIEDVIIARRAIRADMRSRIALNGVVHFPSSAPDDPDWPAQFARWAQLAIRDDLPEDDPLNVAQYAPFAYMSGAGKPSMLEGRPDVSDRVLGALRVAWEAFCLGIDAPKQAVDEGVGQSGSRWQGYLLRDEDGRVAAAPRMARVVSRVTNTHLRPWVRYLGLPIDPARVRVWYRLPKPRATNADDLLRVAPLGLVSRVAMADALGVDAEQLMPLPPGMSELDWWAITQHGRSLRDLMSGGHEPAGPPPAAAAADPAGDPPRLGPGVRVPDEPTQPSDAVLASPRSHEWDLIPGGIIRHG